VLHDDRVVLGLLGATALGGDPTPGGQPDRYALVTDGDGRLIGLIERADLERRLADVRDHAVSG